ncbi:MAG: NUDIX domain-containing protein [Chitinophagaceae bacterium]|nr:MAG: NUDIX domain-containing protein [Chitinophagaceae bacterium]
MFFRNFKIVEAAGGIVQNENKEILFIYRRNKWDLPKGKIEKKELPENAAAREIEEETGIKTFILKRKLAVHFISITNMASQF